MPYRALTKALNRHIALQTSGSTIRSASQAVLLVVRSLSLQ